jgi:hypothetical protein
MPQGRLARRLFGVIALLLLSFAATARAQPADVPAALAGPVQALSANPFTMMYGWYNADYERRLLPNATLDASGSFFSIDRFGYKNANIALKYYPRAAMSGFYIGGRTGIYRVSADGSVRDAGANFYGAGFELGYNWLPGHGDHIVIGLGAGVTRLFGGELAGASLTVPTIRLISVGFTF